MLAVTAVALLSGPVVAVTQAAPGCPASRPTFLGGRIQGYPDGRAVNVLIGVNHKDSRGRTVNVDGVPCTSAGSACPAGYTWTEAVNRTLSPRGSTSPQLDRTWGRCVGRAVVLTTVEVYPKAPNGLTDKVRYGAAGHFNQRLAVGGRNDILLRVPQTYQAGGGNTGAVSGVLTYRGRPVPARYVTRMRAFPATNGAACGVEGFTAAADVLRTGSTGTTYYRLDYLAGGQCGARTQRYVIQADCRTVCGAPVRAVSRYADVARGRATHVDLPF